MKKLIVSMLLVLPCCLQANEPGAVKPPPAEQPDYSRAVRMCMQKADQVQVMLLQMRAAVMAAEVTGLCASGEQAQAQSLARLRIRQLERDPLVKQIRRCSGLANQQVPAETDFCAIDLQSLPVFN